VPHSPLSCASCRRVAPLSQIMMMKTFMTMGSRKIAARYALRVAARRSVLPFSTCLPAADPAETPSPAETPITLKLNGKEVEAKPGDTIFSVARRNDTYIPTLCHHPDLAPVGLCRVCLVDVQAGNRHGLKPACTTKVEPGMTVDTRTREVKESVRHQLELLRCRHPNACMTCSASGRCELQDAVQRYQVQDLEFANKSPRKPHIVNDESSNSLEFDMEKCILCQRCVRACSELQDINILGTDSRAGRTGVSTPFAVPIAETECISCGQCSLHCPVGAITERDHTSVVADLLDEKQDKVIVVQTAPATRIAISEEFEMEPGTVSQGQLVAALRALNFDYVFDTNFTADLTIMEEGTELIGRIQKGGPFPMFTSCCPAWINLVEKCYPEYLPNLSSCKSPQGMLGALVKELFAKKLGRKPEDVIMVSIMPCTAKKDEAKRRQLSRAGREAGHHADSYDAIEGEASPDVDVVLTTRELGRLLRRYKIPFASLKDSEYDAPLGIGSGAAVIFGATGGVMEAALRTAYEVVTGETMTRPEYMAVRGLEGVREATVNMNGIDVRVAVAHTTGHARKLLDMIKSGEAPDYHFIEVMACRGGCLGGGGEPKSLDPDVLKKRVKAIYGMDASMSLRKSHENPQIKEIYEQHLEKPGSEKAEELLHTYYRDRRGEVSMPSFRRHTGGYNRETLWRESPDMPKDREALPVLPPLPKRSVPEPHEGHDPAVEQVFT